MGSRNMFLLSRCRHMLRCKLSSLCYFWSNCWNDWSRRLLLLWLPCFHSLLEYFLALSTKGNHSRKRRHTGQLQSNILPKFVMSKNFVKILWVFGQTSGEKNFQNFFIGLKETPSYFRGDYWGSLECLTSSSCPKNTLLYFKRQKSWIRFFVYKSI